MRPKLLVDVNLSPEWVPVLQKYGWQAVHWSLVGDPRASDRVIMDWAAARDYVVFTHDLDFGTMLALSHEADLSSGALVVVDEKRNRVRVLPI